MGYCISMDSAEFFIEVKHMPDVLAAMKKMFEPAEIQKHAGLAKATRYSWMGDANPQEWQHAKEGFQEWGYPVGFDEMGNIVEIDFELEKMGGEEKMFRAIAPWVKDGSYIHMHGEDGSQWRWLFKGGACKTQDAVITFED